MKQRWIGAVFLSGLLVVPALAEKPKKGTGNIEGTWVGVSAEKGGKKLPEELVKKVALTVTFAKGKYEVTMAGKTHEKVAYKVKPGKRVNTIDIVASEGMFKGEVQPGIYKVEGDTLTMASAGKPGQERPAEFESKEGSEVELTVFKRKKSP